jgi:hypothetical protein
MLPNFGERYRSPWKQSTLGALSVPNSRPKTWRSRKDNRLLHQLLPEIIQPLMMMDNLVLLPVMMKTKMTK